MDVVTKTGQARAGPVWLTQPGRGPPRNGQTHLGFCVCRAMGGRWDPSSGEFGWEQMGEG